MRQPNHFKDILIKPIIDLGANKLKIVSGFATANMADRHLKIVQKDLKSEISIDLIVGMTIKHGFLRVQHEAMKKLDQHGAYDSNFTCNYVVKGNPIHAKIYLWLKDDKVVSASAGSANYTATGFGHQQTEFMDGIDPVLASDFYDFCSETSKNCLYDQIEDLVVISDNQNYLQSHEDDSKNAVGLEEVHLSLLNSKTNQTPDRSGINWGHRGRKNIDEAYISVPASIIRQNFFPDIAEQFTVLTDDHYSFIMVSAQQNGKALHTTQDNSLLGKYLRKRLGLRSGEFVTLQHLKDYGRTDITFIKENEETYHLDFRPNMGPSLK